MAQKDSQYFLNGQTKSKEKKYKEAIDLYTKAIKINDQPSDYFYFRGLSYFYDNQPNLAFEDYSKAIDRDPGNSKAYLVRGAFFNIARQFDKSVIDLTEGLKHTNSDSLKAILLVERSGAYYQKRDFQASIKDCRNALLLDSINLGAINNLAMSLDEIGKYDEAYNYLKKIISIDSSAYYAYINIGFYLSNQKQFKESLPYFDHAIKLNPEEPTSYNNRGYSKFMLKDYDGALKDINKSIKMFDYNSYAFRNRALIYMETGKNIKACEDLDRAKQLGFTKQYGMEVEELIKKNCLN